MRKNDSQTDVLLLSHRYDIVSGGEKALLDLIKYLVSEGVKQHVIIGGHGNIVDELEHLNVPYTIVHLPFWAHGGEDNSPFVFDQPGNPKNNQLAKLVTLIEELKPRLTMTNTIVVPWLAYASALTKTPHAWMIHELHSSGLELQYSMDKKQILRTIDTLSDKIFYNSHYTASYYLNDFTYNTDASILYPVGDLAAQGYPPTSSPFKTDDLKIICVGQIKSQKGQIDIIKACALLKQQGIGFELLLVGSVNEEDLEYKQKLEAIINSADIADQVTFYGHSENPVSLFATADVAINSAINETFGRVTVEAMSVGLAVIGAESAGTIEIIEDGKNGFLYSPGDATSLFNKIMQLYSDPSKLNALSQSAKISTLNRFNLDTNFKPFKDYLETNPVRSSLDLSPFKSLVSDFNTVAARPHPTSALKRSMSSLKRRIRG